VVAVVQARMSSTRLPGKVLAELAGRPAIELLLERLSRARELDRIVVATSVDPSDDPVAATVANAGIAVVRGPLQDVLARYALAGETHDCDAVVRITGDCPLIEPAVVDLVVARWRAGTEDFVANCFEPRTYPQGTDTEVISWPALREAADEAVDPIEREHVTPFVRRRPERYSQVRLDLSPPAGEIRLVLDTADDLEALRALVARAGTDATLDELIASARTDAAPR
jgi:spore coat polysaccharide biosynthesis protein SpsF (cytidylyltransferase family)